MAPRAAPGLVPAIPNSWLIATAVVDLLTPSPATIVPKSPEMAMKTRPKMRVINVFDCANVGNVDIVFFVMPRSI